MKRPKGVTIMAILAALSGTVDLVSAIVLSGLGLSVLIGLALLATTALYFVFAVGAWNLKPWAWKLGVITQIIALIIFGPLVSVVVGKFIEGQIGGLVAPVFMLYLLFNSEVRKAFGKMQPQSND